MCSWDRKVLDIIPKKCGAFCGTSGESKAASKGSEMLHAVLTHGEIRFEVKTN
jgi:hypothetical protein